MGLSKQDDISAWSACQCVCLSLSKLCIYPLLINSKALGNPGRETKQSASFLLQLLQFCEINKGFEEHEEVSSKGVIYRKGLQVSLGRTCLYPSQGNMQNMRLHVQWEYVQKQISTLVTVSTSTLGGVQRGTHTKVEPGAICAKAQASGLLMTNPLVVLYSVIHLILQQPFHPHSGFICTTNSLKFVNMSICFSLSS